VKRRREAEERRILREKKRCRIDMGEAEAFSDSEEINDVIDDNSSDFLPKTRQKKADKKGNYANCLFSLRQIKNS
jgi:hypothetical protein